MTTITTHQAKAHFHHYLEKMEAGDEFVITRGKSPIAKLVPMERAGARPRPSAGDILGEPFEFPLAAFAPLTDDELKKWIPPQTEITSA